MIKHTKLKIVAICVMCLSLQGCLWQSVSGTDLKKAYWYCDLRSKSLSYVTSTWSGFTYIHCEGEERIKLKNVEDIISEYYIGGKLDD